MVFHQLQIAFGHLERTKLSRKNLFQNTPPKTGDRHAGFKKMDSKPWGKTARTNRPWTCPWDRSSQQVPGDRRLREWMKKSVHLSVDLFQPFLGAFCILPRMEKWVYLHLVVRGKNTWKSRIRKLPSLQCATLVHVKSGWFKWRTACTRPRSEWFPFQSDQKRGPKR